MRIVSFLILLILFPLLAIGQPGNPGDPDVGIAPTQFQIAHNPNIVIDGGGVQGQIPEAWVNPNHARVQDDAYATLTTATKNKRTNYLLAQNFGFAVPAGSSIQGIIVQVDRYANSPDGGLVNDSQVSLIDATGVITLHDEASLVPWSPFDLDNYQTYGGLTNTWGINDWTSAKINNPNFGVAIMAKTSNDNATFNLFVDEIRVTVIYLTGGNARYAVATGNWSSSSSWSLTPGGSPGATSPGSVHDVFIGGGHTILVDIATASCNSLTIGTTETNPNGILAFTITSNQFNVGGGGLLITSDGDVSGTSSPTLNISGDVTLNAILTNRNFILRTNALSGPGEPVISGTGSIANLVAEVTTTNTGNLTVTRSLLGNSNRLINGSTGYLKYSGATNTTATLLLDLSATGNTVEFSQTIADDSDFDFHRLSITFQNLIISGNAPKYYNGPIVVFGDLTITSTGILSNQSQTDLTLYGNWTNNNGIAGFIPNTCNGCTVIFKGGNSTISNSAGLQFNRIEVAKDSTLTVSNNIIIDNQFLMTSGIFDLGTSTLTGTANTVFNGGELITATTGLTVPALTGAYTLTNGTITFNGTNPQTIRSSTSTPPIAAYKIVQFLGSGTKTLSGPITATNLVMDGGATLDVTASNYGITLSGNWTNTGSTFLAQSGTVTLNGTTTQKINNPAGETFNGLTINNSAAASAVVLYDPLLVNGLLTFTDGHLISADTSLLSLGASATVTSVTDGSHVDGPVAKATNSTTVFAFPVGTGTNYMPASITPTSTTSTTFKAEYFSLEQSTGTTELDVDHVSAQDYWTVERTSGTADAAVTLVWEYASAADAEIDNLGELVVAQWDGSNWASRGNAGTTGTFVAGSVTSNAVTSFIPQFFVIGSSTTNNPLSNWRYFAPTTGNWNGAGVWSYRPGGPTTAPEPTSTKLVVIQAGKTATILDSPQSEASKSMRSITILGTLDLGNAASQDITITIGNRGLTLGSGGNITGSDNSDEIHVSGDITLNNTANIGHTLLITDIVSLGKTISGSGGKLPILNVDANNQIFTGSTSFTNLTVGSTAINDGTITVTGSYSGNGLTNGASGTVIWQGTGISGNGIIATTPGNTIQLINNTGGPLNIEQFVTAGTFGNLILGGTGNFLKGADVTINGDMTILAGATFNITSGNNNLNIFGNWINDGVFGATSGTVAFNGTTTISGASTSNFNHVLIAGTLTPPSIFNVRGDFTNNGSFTVGTGTVVFNGTATQNISGSVETTFNNLSVTNSSAAVQVQSNQNLAGVLTLSTNSVFDADGSANTSIFTLLSSADNPTIDASVAALPISASVAGNVTVQRYMSVEGNNSGRIYRYISSPVQNAPVSQIQPFIPVTGTFGGSSSCSGCGTAQSMFMYDETVITDINGSGAANSNDGYLNFPASTNSEVFAPGRGYTIFVRANVDPILGFDSVVWSLRGPINSGNVSMPVSFTSSGTAANDGWNLVGNPYPSTIDWDAAGWTRTNLDNTTYMLDNGLGSPVYATHVAGGASTNGGTQYIATGQAFFVKSGGGSPVLQAAESVKASGTPTTFFRTATIADIMRVTLRQGSKADETVIQFKPGATTNFDLISDAVKLDNPAPMYSLATTTSGLRYVINALPPPTSKTEVPLDITSVTAGSYVLAFTEFESFTNPFIPIILRDDFLGTTSDIRTNPNYTFQVTADAGSFGNARFTIVFDVATITGLELDGDHIVTYPNPTKNSVSIEVKSDNQVNAKVISMTGTPIFETDLHGGSIKKGSFNLEEHADGIYILIMQDGAQQYVKKIIKIK